MFVSEHRGALQAGESLRLVVELGDDGRTVIVSLTDPNQGRASETVARIDALLQERLRAGFPDLRLTREERTRGPYYFLPL
jgi:hypothetical protein